MLTHPATVYRRTSVETSSPGQLIVLLYRRAVQSIRQAIQAIERRDPEGAHKGLVHAQEIVFELQSSLDLEAGPFAITLHALYQYFGSQLLEANLHKDVVPAAQVADMLETLLHAWESALSDAAEAPKVVRAEGKPALAQGISA